MDAERASNAGILDTTTERFASDVLDRSKSVAVAVDFWAPWCAPCRALAPILQDLVRHYSGRLFVARVNTDEEPALAAQFAIRSIPDVRIFRDGRLVDGFVGVQPVARLKTIIDKHVPRASAGLREQARAHVLEGNLPGAVTLLRTLLVEDPQNAAASIDLADALARTGDLAGAEQILAALPPSAAAGKDADALRARIFLLRNAAAPDEVPGLRSQVASGSADLRALHRLAAFELLFGDAAQGLELLLTIMRRDRRFEDDLARKSLLQAFQLLGDGDELVAQYRRRMTALLY